LCDESFEPGATAFAAELLKSAVREANQIGNELTLRTATGESPVKIVDLPFGK